MPSTPAPPSATPTAMHDPAPAYGATATEELYAVVVNGEGQHSIWWAGRELPAGWTATGDNGTREQCLTRIGDLWTDMRPATLRARLGGSVAPG